MSRRTVLVDRIGPQMIVVCAWCGDERRADRSWTPQRESTRHLIRRGARVSHGCCDDCHTRQLQTLMETDPPPTAA